MTIYGVKVLEVLMMGGRLFLRSNPNTYFFFLLLKWNEWKIREEDISPIQKPDEGLNIQKPDTQVYRILINKKKNQNHLNSNINFLSLDQHFSFIYTYIVINRQTFSFYQNSSV